MNLDAGLWDVPSVGVGRIGRKHASKYAWVLFEFLTLTQSKAHRTRLATCHYNFMARHLTHALAMVRTTPWRSLRECLLTICIYREASMMCLSFHCLSSLIAKLRLIDLYLLWPAESLLFTHSCWLNLARMMYLHQISSFQTKTCIHLYLVVS